ncbi:hypothetical protein [Lysobacter gummosus]|uniref:hypothetical protein n=1 Tax=Lysobacter gummosus TaxID=262324 RepID=UPI0036307898
MLDLTGLERLDHAAGLLGHAADPTVGLDAHAVFQSGRGGAARTNDREGGDCKGCGAGAGIGAATAAADPAHPAQPSSEAEIDGVTRGRRASCTARHRAAPR